jgi:hypothetical protein
MDGDALGFCKVLDGALCALGRDFLEPAEMVRDEVAAASSALPPPCRNERRHAPGLAAGALHDDDALLVALLRKLVRLAHTAVLDAAVEADRLAWVRLDHPRRGRVPRRCGQRRCVGVRVCGEVRRHSAHGVVARKRRPRERARGRGECSAADQRRPGATAASRASTGGARNGAEGRRECALHGGQKARAGGARADASRNA